MQRPSRTAASKARQSFRRDAGGSDSDDEILEEPETEGSEDEYHAEGQAGSEGTRAEGTADEEEGDDDEDLYSDENNVPDMNGNDGKSKKPGPSKPRIKATSSKKAGNGPARMGKRGASSKHSRAPSAITSSTGNRTLDLQSLARLTSPDKVLRITQMMWPRDGAPIVKVKDLSDGDVQKIFSSWRTVPSGLCGLDLADFGWTPGPPALESPQTFPISVDVIQDLSEYFTSIPTEDRTLRPAPNFHPSIAYGTTIKEPIIAFAEALPAIDTTSKTVKISLGPPDSQSERAIAKFAAENLNQLPSVIPDRAGHIMNVGGSVYSVAWRPVPPSDNWGKEYLAVSTSVELHPRTAFDTRLAHPAAASLQLWSVAPQAPPASMQAAVDTVSEEEYGTSKLEMLLCHESGPAWQVAWCPVGHDPRPATTLLRRLGLLAGTFHDGTLSIFTVPHPEDALPSAQDDGFEGPIAVKVEPLLVLSLPTTTPYCFEWAGGETLAAGCADGSVAVWDVGHALRSGRSTARPSHFFKAHDGPVLSISWLLRPTSPHADSDIGEDDSPEVSSARILLTTATDGTVVQVDLSNPSLAATPVIRSMAPISAGCYVPALQSFVLNRVKDEVIAVRGSMGDYRHAVKLYQHHGPVQCVASSRHHPLIASGSADGSVMICNVVHGLTKSRLTDKVISDPSVSKLFRIDHDRTTGQLRMLDNFREGLPVPPMIKGKTGKRMTSLMKRSALWHPAISVNTVAWCPNIGRGLLLASGMGCGLVRIDWVGQKGGIEGQGVRADEMRD